MTPRNSLWLIAGVALLAMVCAPARMMGHTSNSNALALPAAVAPDCASRGDDDHDRFGSDLREQEQETIRKTFAMSATGKNKSVEVDNVFGSIEVTGGASNEVQLVVNRTNRAESKAKLEEARKKVTLDITQEGDALKLYVNGPFRCQCRDCVSWNGDEGYQVKMDFTLQVPRDIEIKLKTVNSGNIRVRNVSGNFLVRNVNGDIEMEGMAGSGKATTVNGPVTVSFRENPKTDSEFSSVNGTLELRFQKNLSADFRFKTFNGGVYSDFPVMSLPVKAVQEERRGGKLVFRADRFSGGRVGAGGPEIKLENLNGDIRILENHE